MSTQTYYTLLTAVGAAEWTNAQVFGQHVPITHLAVGDGNGNPVVPTESMTALVHEVHCVPISSIAVDVDNPNWLVLEAVLPSTVGGWTVREIGLIGGVSPGNKLLAVGNFPATYKPVLAEGAAKDLAIRMVVQVSNTNVVQITVDPSVVVATRQTVENAIQAHRTEADPHGGRYLGTAHLTDPDPHPQYINASELSAALLAQRAKRFFHATA